MPSTFEMFFPEAVKIKNKVKELSADLGRNGEAIGALKDAYIAAEQQFNQATKVDVQIIEKISNGMEQACYKALPNTKPDANGKTQHQKIKKTFEEARKGGYENRITPELILIHNIDTLVAAAQKELIKSRGKFTLFKNKQKTEYENTLALRIADLTSVNNGMKEDIEHLNDVKDEKTGQIVQTREELLAQSTRTRYNQAMKYGAGLPGNKFATEITRLCTTQPAYKAPERTASTANVQAGHGNESNFHKRLSAETDAVHKQNMSSRSGTEAVSTEVLAPVKTEQTTNRSSKRFNK